MTMLPVIPILFMGAARETDTGSTVRGACCGAYTYSAILEAIWTGEGR